MIVLIGMRYCWIMLSDRIACSVLDFDLNVMVFANGDDNVWSVSNTAAPFFNQYTVAKQWAALGHNYTDASKKAFDRPFCTFEELSYLKRTFRYSDILSRVVAPLEMKTILEMPYWCSSNATYMLDTCDTVDAALRELAYHEAEIYDRWAPQIIRASKQFLNYSPIWLLRKDWLIMTDSQLAHSDL